MNTSQVKHGQTWSNPRVNPASCWLHIWCQAQAPKHLGFGLRPETLRSFSSTGSPPHRPKQVVLLLSARSGLMVPSAKCGTSNNCQGAQTVRAIGHCLKRINGRPEFLPTDRPSVPGHDRPEVPNQAMQGWIRVASPSEWRYHIIYIHILYIIRCVGSSRTPPTTKPLGTWRAGTYSFTLEVCFLPRSFAAKRLLLPDTKMNVVTRLSRLKDRCH